MAAIEPFIQRFSELLDIPALRDRSPNVILGAVTAIKIAYQIRYLIQSQYIDARPTSTFALPAESDICRGSH